MDNLGIIVNIFFIIFGSWRYFVNRDALWQEHMNRTGLNPSTARRTDQWDRDQIYIGATYIIVGIFGIIIMVLT